MSLTDRLKRLEESNAPSKEERWRAAMARVNDGIAKSRRKLAALIERKRAERGTDRGRLPPQTPQEQVEAKRALLQALRANIRQ